MVSVDPVLAGERHALLRHVGLDIVDAQPPNLWRARRAPDRWRPQVATSWTRAHAPELLPGIRVSDDLLAKVEEEYSDPDNGRELARRRLALQMVGVKRLGYAGVHLSGVSAYEEHAALLGLAVTRHHELVGPEAWSLAWQRAHTLRDGRIAGLGPPDGLFRRAPRQPAA